MIPAVPPKFPSIWKGGCISNIFSLVEFERSAITFSYAFSPSKSLAQWFIIHAFDQPVCPPPCERRLSRVALAALASSGVFRIVMMSAG